MVMPYLNETKTSAETIAEFKGYNHNPVTEQNEFYDMENMTGDRFPLIATRNQRGEETVDYTYTGYSNPTILCAYLKGDMRFIFVKYGTGAQSGKVFVRVNDNDETHGYRILPTGVDYISGKHYIVAMGAKLILFPEKIIVNIKEDFYDNTKYTSTGDYIESIELSSGTSHDCTICYNLHGNSSPIFTPTAKAPKIDDTEFLQESTAGGYSYSIYTYDANAGRQYAGTIAAANIVNTSNIKTSKSQLTTEPEHWWWESSADGTYNLYKYDYRTGWTPYPTYIKITNMSGFKEGDAIKLSGENFTPFNKDVKSYIIEKMSGTDAYIKVTLTRSPWNSQSMTFTAARKMPSLDFVVEVNNRLWGCHFGESSDGEYINEIFASKLGDPKNWYSFANTAEDSYYVSLPDAGKFTGAVNYQNNPVFFRENRLHRITGTYPGNFRMNTMVCNGVKEGNNDSLCVLNDICYYMSPYGMCAYNGGIPISLAEAFGDVDYTNAKCDSAATCNELYCLITGIGNDGVFVFDDSKAFWHRESLVTLEQGDSARLADNSREVIAYRTNGAKIDYLATQVGSYTSEGAFNWFIQGAEMGYYSPYHKRLNKLVLKLRLSLSAKARIEIQYDRDGVWHHVNEIRPTGRYASYSVPVSPQRCDTFSLRISGKGSFSLIAITRFWAEGSDRE